MSRVTAEVYASWLPIKEPILAGYLLFQESSRGGVFSFEYDSDFLTSPFRMQLDPSLALTSGEHYNDRSDKNFRVFLDSCPDRWGELLMKRQRRNRRCELLRASRIFNSQWLANSKRFSAVVAPYCV